MCPAVGQKCETILFCGDGIVSYTRGENCDDGGTKDGDGCSAACHIEPNWLCSGSLSACTYDINSLDHYTTVLRYCDDGNTNDNDGCSSICLLEPFCGDGYVDPGEDCDNGSMNANAPNACARAQDSRCASGCARYRASRAARRGTSPRRN